MKFQDSPLYRKLKALEDEPLRPQVLWMSARRIADVFPFRRGFTIGCKASYDQGLEEEEVLTKLGREPGDARYPGYIGGWVWKTQEAAQSYLDANQDGLGFIGHVYGLLLPTSWDVDVTPEPGEDGIHNLLPDAVIFYPYERN